MQKTTIHRQLTGQFSEAQLKYIYNQEQLPNVLSLPFNTANFEKQITEKASNYSVGQRAILIEGLKQQYQGLSVSDKVQENLNLLEKTNTFTVTTGHQLSLFTGPLYFVFKILNAVKLAEELKSTYPNQNFVPVYWMASEDHDFEEIKSIELFGKKLSWESEQKGPVGKFDLEGFESIKDEFLSFFKEEQLAELSQLMSSYSGKNLSEATFKLVSTMFAEFGLVIIDGDSSILKKSFAPIVKKELENHLALPAVEKANGFLKEYGLKEQIHAREINLFYIEKGRRERINAIKDGFEVENFKHFSKAEFFELLEKSPENFSPNVVMRPLYQEFVLPNLCYIGGAGEIAYWLQLKGVFETYEVLYPMISVRNSLMLVDAGTKNKIEKTGFTLLDFFKSTDELKKEFLQRNAGEELDLDFAKTDIQHLRSQLIDKVKNIEVSLEKMVEAEIVKMDKQIHFLEDKLRKTLKAKHEQSMNTIEQVKNRLFPNGGLQERSANFFGILGQESVSKKLAELYEAIEPFENDFIILS